MGQGTLPMDGAAHIQDVPSYLSEPNLEIPSQTYLEVCLPGSSRSHQVGNINHHSPSLL